MTNKRILSGMRSSNPRLHLGNYEGALRNWVALQNEGYEMYCMVADYHALTTMYENSAESSRNAREVAKDYISAGLDPKKSAIFIQSHVKEHSELNLLLTMITPLGWLDRTPTYKEKVDDLFTDLVSKVHEISVELDAITSTSFHSQFPFVDPLIKPIIDHILNEQGRDRQSFLALFGALKGLGNGDMARNASPKEEEIISNACHQIQLHASHLRQVPSVPYGLLGYPVLQTADILLYKPYGVPVGKDQAPHLEIGNDIGRRFNHLYGKEVFQAYKYMIPEDEARAKVPGLDADDNGVLRKMSKSYDNCIYLTDTEDEVAKKIKGAFTTPSKIAKSDPGIPEGCAVCQYLKIYSPDWKNQWDEDRQGIRGCMQNKKELTEYMNEFLRPFRERRARIDDGAIEDILRDGAERARAVASKTMAEVREAMGMF